MLRLSFLTMAVFVLLSGNVYAYVGPGLGLGALGALTGLVVAIFLSIVGLFWYPLKRLLKKFKILKADEKETAADVKDSE